MKDFTRKRDGIDKKRSFKKAKHDNNIDFNTDLNDVLPLIFSFVPDARHKGSFSIHTVCKDWNTRLNDMGQQIDINSIVADFLADTKMNDNEILMFLYDHGKQAHYSIIAMLTSMHKNLAFNIIEEALLTPGFVKNYLLMIGLYHPDVATKLVDAFFPDEFKELKLDKEWLDEAVAKVKSFVENFPNTPLAETMDPAIRSHEDGTLSFAFDSNLYSLAFCHGFDARLFDQGICEAAKDFICSYVSENFSKLKSDSSHSMDLRAKSIVKYPK